MIRIDKEDNACILTPYTHKDGEENCCEIVNYVSNPGEKARVGELPVGAVDVALGAHDRGAHALLVTDLNTALKKQN
jgi:hypothetical protein